MGKMERQMAWERVQKYISFRIWDRIVKRFRENKLYLFKISGKRGRYYIDIYRLSNYTYVGCLVNADNRDCDIDEVLEVAGDTESEALENLRKRLERFNLTYANSPNLSCEAM